MVSKQNRKLIVDKRRAEAIEKWLKLSSWRNSSCPFQKYPHTVRCYYCGHLFETLPKRMGSFFPTLCPCAFLTEKYVAETARRLVRNYKKVSYRQFFVEEEK